MKSIVMSCKYVKSTVTYTTQIFVRSEQNRFLDASVVWTRVELRASTKYGHTKKITAMANRMGLFSNIHEITLQEQVYLTALCLKMLGRKD